MQLTLLSGYPDFVGRRMIWCGHGFGPEHYHRIGDGSNHMQNDILLPFRQTFYYDAVIPGFSFHERAGTNPIVGEFIVYGVPIGVGARVTWVLKWVHADSGEEAENGDNLSMQQVQLAGFGGQF